MRGGEQHGASADFDSFYAGTSARVLRQLTMFTGDAAEAEDVTQEAFERAWLHWSTVRRCGSPEAWVRSVAHRLAVSRWRRVRNASKAWSRHGPPAPVPGLEPEHVALMSALRRLPARQRTAILLHHLADLPVADVAQETGASVAAVKQQLARGRAALADLLADSDVSRSPQVDGAVREVEQ